MIVNRLNGVWKEIISSQQTRFVPGTQGINNIVICQELIRSLGHTKTRKGCFVFKLDLEKAHDRMEWNFIEETLRDAAMPPKQISMIIRLLSSSSCCLLSKGKVTSRIKQSRGLRQVGSIMSIYLCSMYEKVRTLDIEEF